MNALARVGARLRAPLQETGAGLIEMGAIALRWAREQAPYARALAKVAGAGAASLMISAAVVGWANWAPAQLVAVAPSVVEAAALSAYSAQGEAAELARIRARLDYPWLGSLEAPGGKAQAAFTPAQIERVLNQSRDSIDFAKQKESAWPSLASEPKAERRLLEGARQEAIQDRARAERALGALEAAAASGAIEVGGGSAIVADLAASSPWLSWAGELAPEATELARRGPGFQAAMANQAQGFAILATLGIGPVFILGALLGAGLGGVRSLGRSSSRRKSGNAVGGPEERLAQPMDAQDPPARMADGPVAFPADPSSPALAIESDDLLKRRSRARKPSF